MGWLVAGTSAKYVPVVVSLTIGVALATVVLVRAVPAQAQVTCLRETGFCFGNPQFESYFRSRGGVATFGYPISREFLFQGFRVQFFQGYVMQLTSVGQVGTLNLLQQDLMPVTRGHGLRLPPPDAALLRAAPQVADSKYSDLVISFVRQYAAQEFAGAPVRFYDTFTATVDPAIALQAVGDQAGLVPLLNLEVWGLVTSQPTADPTNPGFIYQRYQRSVMHFQASCGCTERLLLADWLKEVLTGDGLPADLLEDMQASPTGRRLLFQYDSAQATGPVRPAELPDTDMRLAFVPDLQVPEPAATTRTGTATAVPSQTLTLSPTQTATIFPTNTPLGTPRPAATLLAGPVTTLTEVGSPTAPAPAVTPGGSESGGTFGSSTARPAGSESSGTFAATAVTSQPPGTPSPNPSIDANTNAVDERVVYPPAWGVVLLLVVVAVPGVGLVVTA